MTLILVSLMAFYFFYILAIGFLMFRKRVAAVKAQRIQGHYFKTYQTEQEVPADLKAIENHYNNQFQVPVFFYLTCLTALSLKSLTWAFLVCALLFIISRLLHTKIHLGSNNVLMRAKVFFSGAIIVAIMWILLIIDLVV